VIREDPDHDAVIRIGGEAPRRWAHSLPRHRDHGLGRVTTTSDRLGGGIAASRMNADLSP